MGLGDPVGLSGLNGTGFIHTRSFVCLFVFVGLGVSTGSLMVKRAGGGGRQNPHNADIRITIARPDHALMCPHHKIESKRNEQIYQRNGITKTLSFETEFCRSMS